MADTKISWTDKVWNPVTGCQKISEGCKNCYAKAIHDMRHKAYQEGKKLPRQYAVPFEKVLCHEDRLEIPMKCKKPKKWFVNSMSDLFHEDVPFKFVDNVFEIKQLAKRHTFQILTKRADRMLQFFEWAKQCGYHYASESLKNVWLGTTVENNDHLERIDYLLQCPAAVRFVSIEPMLGPVDLSQWLCRYKSKASGLRYSNPKAAGDYDVLPGIDWVICGGESGRNARPMHPEWVRSLRDQCVSAGVPFYFKQWGEWLPFWNGTHLLYKDGKFINGSHDNPDCWKHALAEPVLRVGTKRAGCLLDGREWKQFPKVAA